MKFTPLHISLMIHCYAIAEPIPNRGAPAVEEYLRQLTNFGLIKEDDKYASGFTATERGVAWMNMLRSTPLPELRYVDPRAGK